MPSTYAIARVIAQAGWINQRGGTLEGYRRHYPADYGEGPDAIYEADVNELMKRIAQMRRGFLLTDHEAAVIATNGDWP